AGMSGSACVKWPPAPISARATGAQVAGEGGVGRLRAAAAGSSPNATVYGTTLSSVDLRPALYAIAKAMAVRWATAKPMPEARERGTHAASAAMAAVRRVPGFRRG